MTEFNTSLPSIIQLQKYIKDKQEVELKLVTGDAIAGKILWQDVNCFCVADSNDQPITIWRQALVYLKPKV